MIGAENEKKETRCFVADQFKGLCCFWSLWSGSWKAGIWVKKVFLRATREIFSIGEMFKSDEQPPLFLPKTIEIN